MRPESAAGEVPQARGVGRYADVEELFSLHERRLGKFLAQMVSDRSLAEDLLQDTFQDAFRARRLGRPRVGGARLVKCHLTLRFPPSR
jgi:DNA-directed RNA polymerase specialized sigma24 family protein